MLAEKDLDELLKKTFGKKLSLSDVNKRWY